MEYLASTSDCRNMSHMFPSLTVYMEMLSKDKSEGIYLLSPKADNSRRNRASAAISKEDKQNSR